MDQNHNIGVKICNSNQVTRRVLSCISRMNFTESQQTPLPFLGQDIIWKIFTKSDPKTVGRCRTLNKAWNGKLSSRIFAVQNWAENKGKNRNVIIGVGYLTSDSNSKWFTRTDVDAKTQIPINIPVVIDQFGFYSLIGSDHGVLCFRFSQQGMDSSMLIWNPLTRDMNLVFDQASKYRTHAVSLYAFGYMHNTMEYRIVHLHKKNYSDSSLGWSLYNSYENDWIHIGLCQSDVKKMGPQSIVVKGTAYWIGWEGIGFNEPAAIAVFSLQDKAFYQSKIPPEAKSSEHGLTPFNDGIGFISAEKAGYGTNVMLWGIRRDDRNQVWWDKMVRVSGLGVPYNATMFIGKDIISVMAFRGRFANDSEKTNVLLSRLKYYFVRREHLMHRAWEEHVSVKSVTLHVDSLYMV